MWQSLIPAAINIAGGAMAGGAAAGDRRAALDSAQLGLQAYQGLSLPDIEKMKLALEAYQSTGQLDPRLEQAIQLGQADAQQNIEIDPRLRAAQLQQLDALSKLGETGLTPDQVGQLKALQNQAEQENSSRMQAILQDAQRRGMGSSAATLAAQMQSGQSAANRQAGNANQMAGQAFQNALQARAQAAGLGQNMEAQQYQQQLNLANALNQREQFNVQQQANAGQRNIDRFNQAQTSNLNNSQQIANANTSQRNQQQQYNKNLAQQNYDNQLKRAQGVAATAPNVSNAFQRRGDQTAEAGQQTAGGIGQIVSAFGMK